MVSERVFRIRTSKQTVLAFDRWLARYRTETEDTEATHGEAFEELLRRVGELPPKARVY